MVAGMSYRYIYLFVEVIENTYMAIKSRVGLRLHYKKGQKMVAWNIASLWQRSYHLNEDVYNSMLSRGYSGEAVSKDLFQAKAADFAWLFFSLGVFLLLLWMK